MANANPMKATVYESSIVALMMRIFAPDDGAAAVQADFSEITVEVFNRITNAVVVAANTLTIANVIFDTLQTDARWSKDVTGYNFLYTVPVTDLPDGGVTYTVQFKFTTSTGVFYEQFILDTLDVLGS